MYLSNAGSSSITSDSICQALFMKLYETSKLSGLRYLLRRCRMRRTEMLQEIRKMRFEEAYIGWTESGLTQRRRKRRGFGGVSDRTFRWCIYRYEAEGLDGLMDRRLTQASFRRAPVDEVMAVSDRYRRMHQGWSVKHFIHGIVAMVVCGVTVGLRAGFNPRG